MVRVNKVWEYLERYRKEIVILNFLIFIFVFYNIWYEPILDEDDVKIKKDYTIFIFLISCIIIDIIMIIWKIYRFSNIKKNGGRYMKTLSLEEFDLITKETTKLEKLKLYSNPKFIEMINKKGYDERKWNWQLRSRIDGKINNISDDEINDITISDEE
jgi:hypothetical protein